MKKFIVLYYAPVGAMDKMANASPEEAKAGMEPWKAWAEKIGSGLVDWGTPLGNGQKVTKGGVKASDKNVIGYSIIQADDMSGAVDMLKMHPHLDWMDACEIEVHESLPLPGM